MRITKKRINVSLSSLSLLQADEIVRTGRAASRSNAFERACDRWYETLRRYAKERKPRIIRSDEL